MRKFEKYWKVSASVSRYTILSIELDHNPTDEDIQSFINNENVRGDIKIEYFCKVINSEN